MKNLGTFGFVICTSFLGYLCEDNEPLISDSNAMGYLRRFGYMITENEHSTAAALTDGRAFKEAIEQFQKMAGLNVTGEVDAQTVTMMNMPRCGVRDINGSGHRKKRFVLQGSKWVNNDITYRISKYPARIVDKSKVEAEIAKAFKVWSDFTPLTFTMRRSGSVNIDIQFVKGDHGDGDPFHGQGGTLAHAFFPRYGGDVHFDDAEKWTINEYGGINLFQVAAHEFGHSLGLSHSDVRRALMAPFYRGFDDDFRLDKDDIEGIQALYGSKEDAVVKPKPRPSPKPVDRTRIRNTPNICLDSRIDAVTRTEDKSTYIFRNQWYWKLEAESVANGYPRRIRDDWPGLPDNIDAALTWSDGKTFFFKGELYWRFKNRVASSGYPQKISVGFAGIPDDLDAAFVWSGNGKTYFFKGSRYWRYDSRAEIPVSKRYPQEISTIWEGIPNNIDAAFQWQNGYTYFFKDQSYYRFNDREFTVDAGTPSYPRSIAEWWFDCKELNKGYLASSESPMIDQLKEKSRRAVNSTSIVPLRSSETFDIFTTHADSLISGSSRIRPIDYAFVIAVFIFGVFYNS